jgi:streptogramin lyase
MLSLDRLTLIAALLAMAVAGRAQITFTEYPGPTTPTFENGHALTDITAGPDGNLWFTEDYAFGAQTNIGRITPNGVTTYFAVPSGSSEGGIAAGPDGNLWFTEARTNNIGRITPSGAVTEFRVPTGSSGPSWISKGSDGNLWFTEDRGNNIGRITLNGVIAEFPVPTSGSLPRVITLGPDGNLWFGEPFGNQIGRITPAGAITEFLVPTGSAYPYGITAGPDGNLWFTENSANKIGRITPSGVITEFPVPTAGANPLFITGGPDGNVWFTESTGSHIGSITPAGTITEYAAPSPGSMGGITTGPDGNLWFMEDDANKIVKASLTIQKPWPNLGGVSFYGGSGDQTATGIAAGDGVYVSGWTGASEGSLAMKFPLSPAPSPLWAASWPTAPPSPDDVFTGVAVTAEGAYFTGFSKSQTTDSSGDKEHKSVLVKFPLTGATGPDVGGATWIAKPHFFSYEGGEAFFGDATTSEDAQPFVYATGWAQSGGANFTATLAKYDAAGNQIWGHAIGNIGSGQWSAGNALTTLNGEVYVAGFEGTTLDIGGEAALWKYDSSGNQTGHAAYLPLTGIAQAQSVAASGNCVYTAGYLSAGPNGGKDVLVLKYDEAGNLLWHMEWGGSGDDIANGITAVGNRVYVVGSTDSFGAGGNDAFLLEIAASTGKVVSSKYYGGAQDDVARGIVANGNDIYVVGDSKSFATYEGNTVGESEIMLLHYVLNTQPVPGDIAPVGPGGLYIGPNGQSFGDGKIDLRDVVASLRVYAGLDALP